MISKVVPHSLWILIKDHQIRQAQPRMLDQMVTQTKAVLQRLARTSRYKALGNMLMAQIMDKLWPKYQPFMQNDPDQSWISLDKPTSRCIIILLHEKPATLITNSWVQILISIMEEDLLVILVPSIVMAITIPVRIQTIRIKEVHAWVDFVESAHNLVKRHTCPATTPTKTTRLQTINKAYLSKTLPPTRAMAAWYHRITPIIQATTKARIKVSKILQAIQSVATLESRQAR